MGTLRRFALVIALALGAGCLDSSVTTCEDGTLCPAGTVCSSQGCVLPEQVDACATLDDGERCGFSGVSNGRCVDGVCVSFGCGNGVVEDDQGEVCDDGNTDSGDGCRADCQKLEVCGDEVEDAGEACDDGNANAADGCDACAETEWVATAIIGGNTQAIEAALTRPEGVAVDAAGSVYLTDTMSHLVQRVDRTGVITTVAGTGTAGWSGDGGVATSAQLDTPTGVAVDGLGNVFITDTFNDRVRRVDAGTGVITTVAGGSFGTMGDGGPATSAQLGLACALAVDGLGNLFIADSFNHRIRRVDAITRVITTIAGTGVAGFLGDNGPAIAARLNTPQGIAVDDDGAVYVSDRLNNRIRRIDPASQLITTVAGTATAGYLGDGGAATSARLDDPVGLAIGGAALLIAENDNHVIRRVDLITNLITTVAGIGTTSGFSGDGAPATAALLRGPIGVAAAADGTVAITDTDNHRIRQIDPVGIISSAAGTGAFGSTGDGGVATSTPLSTPTDLAVDGAGNVYIADSGRHRIRRVDAATGVITTVAGTGIEGFAGDGGLATSAELDIPRGVEVDAAGNLYISDSLNLRVRRVDAATGIITTVAGVGGAGPLGDGGAATLATLAFPIGLAVDPAGTLYIADPSQFRVRRVDAVTGVITTVAGTGTDGYSGDGGLAVAAEVTPLALALDAAGRLYIADYGHSCIRRVDFETGLIETVAGSVTAGFSGDGGPAIGAELDQPTGVAVDAAGVVYIADQDNRRVRRVDPSTGEITSVVGSGNPTFSGDGGTATSAGLVPEGLAVDAGGSLYISDGGIHRVRRLDVATGILTTVAGDIDPEGMGPVGQAHLLDPSALVLAPSFTLVAGGSSGRLQAIRATEVEVVAGRYPHSVATGDLARFRVASHGPVGGVAHDDAVGEIYLTETTANRVHVVTTVDPDDEDTWTIAPLAGDGLAGFADGAAATARFRAPTGLYLDAAARVLYVADTGNHVIRAIDLTTDQVTTIAGTPQTRGFFGDTGPASDALLFAPEAITRCGNGDLFVADTGNHRVRRIDSAGMISTVLGDGVAASSGQGEPARDFPVREPRGLACDATGNLYVTSSTTVRQVAADDLGVVDGSGAVASILRRELFPGSVTYCLTGLAVVDDTTLQITDSCTGMLIELERE